LYHTLGDVGSMSALPPKADIKHSGSHVRLVPLAVVSNRSKQRLEHAAGMPLRAAKVANWTRRLLKKASAATNSASARARAIPAKVASISRLVLASKTWICSPRAPAAFCIPDRVHEFGIRSSRSARAEYRTHAWPVQLRRQVGRRPYRLLLPAHRGVHSSN